MAQIEGISERKISVIEKDQPLEVKTGLADNGRKAYTFKQVTTMDEPLFIYWRLPLELNVKTDKHNMLPLL